MNQPFIRFEDLHWSSDWNGDEVGYDHLNVVGLYTWNQPWNQTVNMYIDMETMQILEMWAEVEDE